MAEYKILDNNNSLPEPVEPNNIVFPPSSNDKVSKYCF